MSGNLCPVSFCAQSGICDGCHTHVATAMTVRPIKDASNTKQPNCSRIGILILTMTALAKTQVRKTWADDANNEVGARLEMAGLG